MIFKTYVPHSGPIGAKILLVGESPGDTEEREGVPFVGDSGQILRNVLGRAGMFPDDVRLANLSNFRPAGNKFELLIGSAELKMGIAQLHEYIRAHPPNVIGALGAKPLEYLTDKKGIHQWRGSILEGYNGVKVIPTFHPSAVLRDRTLYPTFDQDIRRIVSDSEFKELRLPIRNFVINPRGVELEEWVNKLCQAEYLGTDIETVRDSTHILCIGFAPSPDLAVVIVNDNSLHYHQCVQRILASQAKKIFQFGTFDNEQIRLNDLLEANMFVCNNYYWDTLVAQHVMWPELKRSLAYLTSIYTREPYYKHDGKSSIPGDQKSWSLKQTKQDLYIYNGKDDCCTIEIALKQMQEMDENERRIFDFEMDEVRELIPEVGTSGLPIDEVRRNIFKQALLEKWWKLQAMLETVTGEDSLNVKSNPKMVKLLYTTLGFPPRRKRAVGDKPATITADEDAIIGCIGITADKLNTLKTDSSKAEWKKKQLILKAILEIRSVRQLLSNYILIGYSADGRMRSTYKAAATETGRWAAEGYVDGTGNNPQTWPRGEFDVPQSIIDLFTDLVPEAGLLPSANFDSLINQLDESDLILANGEEDAQDED